MTTREQRVSAMRFIVCLGIVSLFADMTYEGAYSQIGPYLNSLHASPLAAFAIAGAGEMFAASLRYFSGKFADRTRAYWALAISGYVVNLLVIPALAFTGNWKVAMLLIFAERSGKALRGPARDVLLSDATGNVGHGWGFGIHGAMDQTGAVVGPIWVGIAYARSHSYAAAFLPLAIPAAAALTALLVARAVYPAQGRPPKTPVIHDIPKVFWTYVIAASLLAFGFVDFPALAYHFDSSAVFARTTQWGVGIFGLLYAMAMGVEGLAGLLLGKLYDKAGITILSLGTLVSLLSLPLGFLYGPIGAIFSVVCWGVGMGAQDACLRSGIASVVSMNKRGYAFGVFNAAYGILWFLGSLIMGYLYKYNHLNALVGFGVAAQLAAAILFFSLRGRLADAAATHSASA